MTNMTNEQPNFDDLNVTHSNTQPTQNSPSVVNMTNEQPNFDDQVQRTFAPLPRGAGVVDYRTAMMYGATTYTADELQTVEDTAASGCQVVDVSVPYATSVPTLDDEGKPKLGKDGKAKFKKATLAANVVFVLDEDSTTELTDNAAGAVLSHITHTMVGQIAKQGIEIPTRGVVTTKWLFEHFQVSRMAELLESVFTPWTTAKTGGKVAVATQNALLCNASVDGTSPSAYISTALTHITRMFVSHQKSLTGKAPSATQIKQATAVLEQLKAAYVKHDKALEAYFENQAEIEAAEAAGTEPPKSKRKPTWKLPQLKSTIPAVDDMRQTLESSAKRIRTNITAMRNGAIPKKKDAEYVARYLESMPASVEALVYANCILSAISDKMKADAEKRAKLAGEDITDQFSIDDDLESLEM